MSNQPFNDTDQQTRRQVLKDTYFSRAQSEADMIGGRFKKETATQVVGVPTYPTLPSGNPWSSPDPTGPEPTLGYEIDALPALGGESPAPVHPFSVETANATSDGGGLAAEGRDGGPPSVSARSIRRRW